MTALHIGCLFPQVGSAKVFDAVRPSAALAALDDRIIADARDKIMLTE
jgi:hypothetical protein